ncbi:protein BatD [candidate division WOR-3 bacterium]|nr:protein BatD [candidate division WOR-3 bacterium]
MLKKIGSIILVWYALLFAGELTFSASVNRTTIGTGEQLLLTVTVSGENIGGVPSPHLPDLPDFDVGGRSSSQSTNIQFVNGKVTQQQTITYVYTLYPKQTGEFTIGACTIEFDGQTYETQPISITVVKGTAPLPPPAPGTAPADASGSIQDNMKLVARTSRRTMYAGEQVNVDFTFYNRLVVANINLSGSPSFSGCWVEPVYDAQQLQYQQQTVDGVVYNVVLLKKVALFPVAAGEIKISPMTLAANVVVRRGFFGGEVRQIDVASDPIILTVKPLPDGAPDAFTGGVGAFSMKASLDRDTSVAAEPIYLLVRISGTGNVRLIEKPALPTIPGVKVLDPEVKDNINTSQSMISGYKEFRYPLIPQADGEHAIPPITIAYFDINTKSYHVLETGTMTFVATRTSAATQAVQSDGMKILGSDIRYIKDDRSTLTSYPGFIRWWIALFYFLGCLFVAGSFFFRKHQARMLTDRAYARKLRASRTVKKNLRAAEHALKEKKVQELLDLVSMVLLGYIGDRFNLDPGALTKEQLIATLQNKGIDTTLLKNLDDLLHECDVVRYSPGTECDDPEKIFQMTKEVLRRL